MKFGLFVTPNCSGVFRCIDGEWTVIPSSYPEGCSTPEQVWEALSTMTGKPARGDVISQHEHLETLIINRTHAKLFYGIPDDVGLYTVKEVKKQ